MTVPTLPRYRVRFMPGAGPFDVAGDFYLLLTGTSRATTPDVAALDITGDIDIRIDARLDDWWPAPGANYELIGKRVISGNQKSWLLFLNPSGGVTLRWSADGSTDLDAVSTVPLPAHGGRQALRATLDVDNGAGGKTATFYTADPPESAIAFTGGDRTAFVVTLTGLPVDHGIQTGHTVIVNSTDDTFDGTHTVTATPTATSIRYSQVGLDDTDAGSGTIRVQPPWVQLGAAVTTSGTTSIFNSTAPLDVGDVAGSGFTAPTGRVYSAEVRSGIGGTAAANPDFSAQTPGTTAFTDAAGRSWTVTAPATIFGFDWTQIPDDRVKSLRIGDGRDHELDVFAPSTATVVLGNNDRRYDPEHTTGPHFGDLLPRVPFQVQLSHDGTTWRDWFFGFVKDGWRQGYRKTLVSTCTVDLQDLLGVIENEPLPATAYDAEVARMAVKAYWKLDESEGVQMFDSSGNGFHGRRDNGEAVDPLVAGDGRAFHAAHVGDHRGIFIGEGLPTTPPCTIVAWIKTPRDLAAQKTVVAVQRDNSLSNRLWTGIETSSTGSPNGEFVIDFAGLGTFYKARGHVRCDDDAVHQVAAVIGSTTAADVALYVDGAVQTKTTVSGTNGGNWPSDYWWTVGNMANNGFGDYGLDGAIDEVAVFDRALTAAEMATLYEAGTTAFVNEFTGARINRVLDLLGVPSDLRDIATGDTTVGPAAYGSTSAGSYLQKVVESEQGVLYVDHRAGGKLKFRGRYARFTETRSTTSQATFTPSHFREDVVPEPNGIGTVVNVVDVEWRGGTETVVDQTSRQAYGPQSRGINTEAPTPTAARSAGDWMIARYKDPQVRLRHLPLDMSGKTTLWPTVLGLRISDRVTVQRHPQSVGAAITNQVIVEGLSVQLNDDRSWQVDFQLSNADDSQVWIWGTAQWGTTTVWG